MSHLIGKRVSGRYEVIEIIGGGGMADVFKAKDIILDRIVAVKVLQSQFSKDEQFIRRFRREAQAATSLAHPNVVNIYDVGEEGDLYYIVMEYVEGPTLKEYIQQSGPLPATEAVDIMSQIVSAIAHAHANHIVHRDLKPQNILINQNGEVKVADFGIARAISSATITHTNSVIGSVHYLSPEQARGGLVNFKSDIYSLGIVLYEMLTGKLPFFGDTAVSIAIKHLQADIPSVREINPLIPQSLENIITKATAKDPYYRYESAIAMEEDLATALDPERRHEEKYVIADDLDEQTRTIPMIKGDILDQVIDEEKTIELSAKSTNFDESPKKPKKKKRTLKIVLSSLLILVGLFIVLLATIPGLLKVEDVKVPEVIGLEFSEAEKKLTDAKLVVVREDIADNEVEEEHVVRITPAEGSSVKKGSEVKLFVSVGKEKTPMPSLVGLTKSQAERMLHDYKVEFKEKATNDVAPGTVLEQTPEAGTPIVVEEAEVIVTVSVAEKITLHNLVGLSEADVNQYAESERLIIKPTFQYSDSTERGLVVSQEPKAFTKVSIGQEVKVVYSMGKKPEPEPPKVETRVENPKFTIYVEEEDREAGRSFEILITYDDATTTREQIFIQETVTDTKTYQIPLTISKEKAGTYKVYIDGKYSNEKTFTY